MLASETRCLDTGGRRGRRSLVRNCLSVGGQQEAVKASHRTRAAVPAPRCPAVGGAAGA